MVKEKWICDKCNQPIEKVENAWFTWSKNLNDGSLSNFKIIHHPTCKKPEPKIQKSKLSRPGDPLKRYLGKNGLVRLLELLSKTNSDAQNEMLEMIQRLQVPGYERARSYFEEAYADKQIVPPNQGVYYPTIEKIQEIIIKYEDEK